VRALCGGKMEGAGSIRGLGIPSRADVAAPASAAAGLSYFYSFWD
jgi:hypothetical protein